MKLWKPLALAGLLALTRPGHAEMEVAPPVKIAWNGFVQAWAGVGENAKHEYVNAGVMLKRFRIRMQADAYDGVSVVLVPEMAAAGFQLLDGYAAIDLSKYNVDFIPPLTVTAGQFKTPFGLNRMYTPPQLALVDYSTIYNGANGVMQTTNFWDDGMMLTYKPLDWIKADAAWVEGLGPNLGTPVTTAINTKPNQDFAGRLELALPMVPGLALGGSIYYGEAFTTPGVVSFPGKPKLFTGAHLKYAAFGKSFGLEAEFINRDVDRGALTLQLTQYVIGQVQLVFGYDHMTDYRNDKSDATRYLGGLNYFPGGPVRISVQQMGVATGSSQQPMDSRTIVQTQVTW